MELDLITQEAKDIQAEYSFDPMMIAAIVQAIIAAIQLVNDCKKQQSGLRWKELREIGNSHSGQVRVHRAISRRIGTFASARLGGLKFARMLTQRARVRQVTDLYRMRAEATRFDATFE